MCLVSANGVQVKEEAERQGGCEPERVSDV